VPLGQAAAQTPSFLLRSAADPADLAALARAARAAGTAPTTALRES
jgi:hypothetical protein